MFSTLWGPDLQLQAGRLQIPAMGLVRYPRKNAPDYRDQIPKVSTAPCHMAPQQVEGSVHEAAWFALWKLLFRTSVVLFSYSLDSSAQALPAMAPSSLRVPTVLHKSHCREVPQKATVFPNPSTWTAGSPTLCWLSFLHGAVTAEAYA